MYLKLRPHHQQTISQKALYKIGSRYYGSFKVEKQIGEVAYKLELSLDSANTPSGARFLVEEANWFQHRTEQ